MHQRLAPRRYALRHSLFMFYLDLDEIAPLAQALRLFSRNRWNLYGFHDADHLPERGAAGAPLRTRLLQYLAIQGIALPPQELHRPITACAADSRSVRSTGTAQPAGRS